MAGPESTTPALCPTLSPRPLPFPARSGTLSELLLLALTTVLVLQTLEARLALLWPFSFLSPGKPEAWRLGASPVARRGCAGLAHSLQDK